MEDKINTEGAGNVENKDQLSEGFVENKDQLSEGFKETEKNRLVKNCKKRKCWRFILLNAFIVIASLLVGFGCAFSLMRYRGEKRLETEERHTIYNGKEYRSRKGVVNILCLGIDKPLAMDEKEENRDNIGMSDAILLVSIDTKKNSVKVIAIPRDTMAEVQKMSDGGVPTQKEKMQICYQYAYGRTSEESNELTVEAVSRLLYNTPIQRCCAINDNAIPILNDAVGGVDVVVQEDLGEWAPELKYGEQIHLEGELAYRYINVRNKSRVDGSLLRTQRQKQYAVEFAKRAKEVVAQDPSVVIDIFQELLKGGNMTTDITAEDISYLLPEFLQLSFSDNIIEVLPGESILGETEYVEYHLDTEAVKQMVIDTFYEEI